jgi:hypothetical protein
MSIARKIIIFVLGLALVAVMVLIYLGSSRKLTKTVVLDVSKPVSGESQQMELSDIESVSTNVMIEGGISQDKDVKSAIPDKVALKEVPAEVSDPSSEVKPTDAKKTDLKIINRLVSWGFQKSEKRKIDTIIVHTSYDAIGDDPYDVTGLIAEYKSYGVSPHYLIDRKGAVYRLVSDQNVAYHAGESQMPDGRKGVNFFSIGIEMMTTKKEKLTEAQYLALNQLVASLKENYAILEVLGHDQIAPGRKDDPWNFDWKKLKK